MDALRTIVDHQATADSPWLPAALRTLYDGDLRFETRADRPTVIANFVSSLDGVVSLNVPGRSGGGEISGFDAGDRLIMGILRAAADAVVVGAGTLHGDPGHVRIPSHVCPELSEEFARWRESRELSHFPLNVIVSASGRIDLDEPTFHTTGLETVILTTASGRQRLLDDHGGEAEVTQARVVSEDPSLRPVDILRVLHSEFGVRLLLHEGGPTLFGAFLRDQLVDELFLTTAPQIVGRSKDSHRLSLVEGADIAPHESSWWRIVIEKALGDFRYCRMISRPR